MVTFVNAEGCLSISEITKTSFHIPVLAFSLTQMHWNFQKLFSNHEHVENYIGTLVSYRNGSVPSIEL